MTENAIQKVSEHLPEAPVPPMVGIAAIALQQAMQYWDINMVKDGSLYQQYKIEGRNMTSMHLDMVFDTAKRIEEHLITANDRISSIAINALLDTVTYSSDLEKEFVGILTDFMDEETPLHPDNRTLKEKFKEVGFKEGFSGCDDENIHTFAKACGIDDHEISVFNSALKSHFGEDTSLLISKIRDELCKPDASGDVE